MIIFRFNTSSKHPGGRTPWTIGESLQGMSVQYVFDTLTSLSDPCLFVFALSSEHKYLFVYAGLQPFGPKHITQSKFAGLWKAEKKFKLVNLSNFVLQTLLYVHSFI